jgi:hypothetical protein
MCLSVLFERTFAVRRGFVTPGGSVGWCGYCDTVFMVNYCEFGGKPAPTEIILI